jgi:hypothetical protein
MSKISVINGSKRRYRLTILDPYAWLHEEYSFSELMLKMSEERPGRVCVGLAEKIDQILDLQPGDFLHGHLEKGWPTVVSSDGGPNLVFVLFRIDGFE